MNFTKHNSGGFGLEFVWRGLTFEWDGRRRRYWHHDGERTWWVTHTSFEKSLLLGTEDPAERTEKQREEFAEKFATARWIAHCGFGGDAAERDTIEQALDASLQYSLRYHHRRLHELRGLLFANEKAE